MKNLLKISILTILIIFIVSCSNSDNDSPNNDENSIIGLWELTELRMSIAQDLNGDGNSSTNLKDELDCLENFIQFNDDMTYLTYGKRVEVTENSMGFSFECLPRPDVNNTYILTEDGVLLQGDDLFYEGTNLVNESGMELPSFSKVVYTKIN